MAYPEPGSPVADDGEFEALPKKLRRYRPAERRRRTEQVEALTRFFETLNKPWSPVPENETEYEKAFRILDNCIERIRLAKQCKVVLKKREAQGLLRRFVPKAAQAEVRIWLEHLKNAR